MGILSSKIDLGRVIVVPIFSLLLMINVLSAGRQMAALGPVSVIKIAKLTNCFLTAAYYALLVFLYLFRRPAKASINSLFARNAAVTSTFMPLTIPFITKQSDIFSMLIISTIVAIVGMLLSLYSLSSLGRSLSIIPEARRLVQTGAYRIVRHPLYLGELIAVFGIVLARFSFSTIAIFFLFAGLLAYRALEEEKFLANIFPEYESYSKRKNRLIPGIF